MGLMDVLKYIIKTFPAIAKSASEAYSELGQTPKMELFVKKAPSQIFVWVLNNPLKMATLFVKSLSCQTIYETKIAQSKYKSQKSTSTRN